MLSNGGQEIGTTPKVSTLSLPSGAIDGPNIPDPQALFFGVPDTLSEEGALPLAEYGGAEHLDRAQYGLDDLPMLHVSDYSVESRDSAATLCLV